MAGAIATNAARMVSNDEAMSLAGERARFVGRGGEKLQAALEHFALEVAGKRALDVGASTGGFTDCLLQNGAASVVALDVGYGQLHERLRSDTRVDVRERVNVRDVTALDFVDPSSADPSLAAPSAASRSAVDQAPGFDVITVDVSFISLQTIAAKVADELAAPGADLIVLIKPQFEAGKAEVSKGKGVIRDPEIWRRVIVDVLASMEDLRAATMGAMTSPITGADGNVEFLAWLRPHSSTEEIEQRRDEFDVDELIASVGV